MAVEWMDLAALWDKDDGGSDGKTIATGKLDNKLCRILGIAEGTGLVARVNDKGDNPNRPDIRIRLALDPEDHAKLTAQLGELTNGGGGGGWSGRRNQGTDDGEFDRRADPTPAAAAQSGFDDDDDDPFADV